MSFFVFNAPPAVPAAASGHVRALQYIITAPGTSTLDLTVDDNHGRCNVVFVGQQMSSTQIEQLTLYSQRFQVRYFEST